MAWLLFWALRQAILRWAHKQPTDEPPAAVERWVNTVTGFLRKTISIAALVISTLILLYGVGIEGLPRLTWQRIADWMNEYVTPIAFILGSGYVFIQFLHLLIARLPAYLSSSDGSFSERPNGERGRNQRGDYFDG